MKKLLKRIRYPKSVTRNIYLFFVLSLFPVFIFSLLLNGITEYGEQFVSSIKNNSILEEGTYKRRTYEEFSLDFSSLNEETNKVVGSSYVDSQFILSTSVWSGHSISGAYTYSTFYFVQTEDCRDQFFNYYNDAPAHFSKPLENKEGCYASEECLKQNGLKVGSRLYLHANDADYDGDTIEIIGSFKGIEGRDYNFYIVKNDLSDVDFDLFRNYSFHSLHTLNKSVSYNYSIELISKISNEIQTRAIKLDYIIGAYQKVLNTGEVFAIVSTIAVSLLSFYSILGRGSQLKDVNHIQYLYYKEKRKLALNFTLENLLNYAFAVITCLIISALAVFIVYLKYGLAFFIGSLSLFAVFIDCILVIIASLLSYYLNNIKN